MEKLELDTTLLWKKGLQKHPRTTRKIINSTQIPSAQDFIPSFSRISKTEPKRHPKRDPYGGALHAEGDTHPSSIHQGL